MMTTRQMLSMIVSCLVYGHTLGLGAAFGSAMVFGVLFFKMKRKYDAAQRGLGS